MTTINPELQSLRLDTWLWASRFYKTRALAQKAIKGGKVRYNGLPPKQSTKVNIGAHVIIHQGHIRKEVIVCSISNKRGPAQQAALLYKETPASLKHRQIRREQDKLISTIKPPKRPDKRSRRQLIAMKNGQNRLKDKPGHD